MVFLYRALFCTLNLLLVGCALAPLTSGAPARPVGAGQWETTVQWTGYTDASGNYIGFPLGKVRYGADENTTLSLTTEMRTLGLGLHHAYWKSAAGTGFASVEAGAAWLAGGFSFFAGHSVSAKWGNWEPFLGIQFYLLNLRPGTYDASYFKGNPASHFPFVTANLGTRYWVREDISVGLHGNILFHAGSVRFVNSFLHSLSFNFAF